MPPKTVVEKVRAVIEELADPEGASRVAIAKRMAIKFPDVKAPLIKKAIATGLQKAVFVEGTSASRFAVAGQKLEAAAKPSVTKTVLKEAAADSQACALGDMVDMAYVGQLDDGSVFDKASHFKFQLGIGEVIKGWDQGVLGMKVGEKARLVVPASLGYGKRGSPPEIPGDATLNFTVTLNKIV